MMFRRARSTVAIVLVLAAASVAAGAAPAPDTRVRISVWENADPDNPDLHTGTARLTGTYVGCEGDEMIIRPDGDGSRPTQAVPLASVSSLEIHQGRNSHALEGALLGAVAGLAIAFATKTDDHSDEFLGGLADMEENLQRGAVITIAGTVVGAAVGSAAGSDVWQPAPVPARCAALGHAATPPLRLAVGFTF